MFFFLNLISYKRLFSIILFLFQFLSTFRTFFNAHDAFRFEEEKTNVHGSTRVQNRIYEQTRFYFYLLLTEMERATCRDLKTYPLYEITPKRFIRCSR